MASAGASFCCESCDIAHQLRLEDYYAVSATAIGWESGGGGDRAAEQVSVAGRRQLQNMRWEAGRVAPDSAAGWRVSKCLDEVD